MKLRHLMIFKYVCEEMNMTKAAKRLFMSQPAVSQTIRELEDKYQTQLFERLSHKLYLTESGAELLRYAEHILALNSELEEVMKSRSRVQKIKVGATVTIGTYCLPQWIADINDKIHDVDILSSIKNTEDIERSILNSTIDLGLVEGDINAPDIIVKPFIQDELVIICHGEHELSTKEVVNKEDLENERFLIRENGSGSRRMFLDMVKNHGISIQIVGEFNNNEAIKNGVSSGLGLGVVSKASICAHDNLIKLNVKDMKMTREFSLIYHNNKLLNKGIRAFMDYILK